MKSYFLIIVFSITFSLVGKSQSCNITAYLDSLLDNEYETLSKTYEECQISPCYGDSIFLKTWLGGLRDEKCRNYNKASMFYQKALKIERFELSSYEVGFSLGRNEIRRNHYSQGIEILKEFVNNARADLNDKESPWELTGEGINKIMYKIIAAERIIEEYENLRPTIKSITH